jgi:hypothetical protein
MTKDNQDKTRATQSRNEGEGNRTAAREYNDAQRDFVKSGKVKDTARQAERALDREKRELDEAEAIGRSREKAEDPAVKRKY